MPTHKKKLQVHNHIYLNDQLIAKSKYISY